MSIALPFLGHGCFDIWPWKSKVKVIGDVKSQSPIVGPTSYRLTFISFHVNIGPPIPEILYLKIWPWKSKVKVMGEIKVQGQIVDPTSYQLTSFVPCQLALQFLRYSYFAIWSRKYKVKVMSAVQFADQIVGPTLYQGHGQISRSQSGFDVLLIHIHFVPCQSVFPSLRYGYFKVWPWKSRVLVMGKVKVQGHIVVPTSYWLTSLLFHVNLPSHSWDTAISKFDLESPRSRSSMGEIKVQGQIMG